MMRSFDFQKMPIVDIVNEILVDASKRGASDIHFDPYEEYLLIRIRIDGDLFDYSKVSNSYRDYLVTRIKTISKMNITESRRPQDGAIKTIIQNVALDLRVSALPVSNGEKIVIRILDYSRSMSGISELGFSEKNYQKLLEMIAVPNGIILVTGATGSGKSTTVYSILQHLNKSTTNIITVEDPIEMDIRGINQVQVNSQIGLDFAAALRSILRQDPNIIMIGEIRDTETAKIAVRASITGHLVLSTVHTNNSLNTIERLIDMEVSKYLLAAALEGIISQKLARRLCTNCRVLRKTTDYEKQIFKVVTDKVPEQIYDVKGCDKCHGGYSGRIAIQEVLKINQKIRDALSENVNKEKLRDMVYNDSDVTTLLEDGLNKVMEGYTTFSEIINLIELDNDNKIYENFDLKQAIQYTKEAHHNSENIVNNNEQPMQQQNTMNNVQQPMQPQSTMSNVQQPMQPQTNTTGNTLNIQGLFNTDIFSDKKQQQSANQQPLPTVQSNITSNNLNNNTIATPIAPNTVNNVTPINPSIVQRPINEQNIKPNIMQNPINQQNDSSNIAPTTNNQDIIHSNRFVTTNEQ